MLKRTLLLAAALMIVSSVTAMACGEATTATPAQKASMTDMETPQEMTVKGQLVCLGCTLKADGAKSACSEFGCSHALKTADGQMIGFLHNKFSKSLVAGEKLHNKMVSVTGTYFGNANVFDVKSYALEGGKQVAWCEGHTSMDACMASH